MAATEAISSPALFRKWAAISAISGALERKVWVRTKGSNLYPNLYVVLCAPPGVGKTEIIDLTRQFWAKMETHHLANSNVTKASLIDGLTAAERQITLPGHNPPFLKFNSLLIGSNELGVLITAYDNEFMSTLTDLYDGKHYSESRRTNKLHVEIDNPHISMIAGCTPGYLREVIPPGAWDQGFMSRVIIIYSGDRELRSLFSETELDRAMTDDLAKQLKEIGRYYGNYVFTNAAAELIDHWYLGGQQPQPDHPRLFNYSTRRPAHILKLSMIAAASLSATMTIDVPHIQMAMDWLFEAEYFMPDIFKAMAQGGDSQTITDAYHHLYTLYMSSGKKPIAEYRLVLFLQERTPAHNIMRILEVMERAKILEKRLEPGIGTAYIPLQMRQI